MLAPSKLSVARRCLPGCLSPCKVSLGAHMPPEGFSLLRQHARPSSAGSSGRRPRKMESPPFAHNHTLCRLNVHAPEQHGEAVHDLRLLFDLWQEASSHRHGQETHDEESEKRLHDG